jgi:uncharacterized protein YjbJ (UPF0337 family)
MSAAPKGSASSRDQVAQEDNMNRDEIKGKTETVKGKIKQAAGQMTGDSELHDEGVADEAAGNARDAFGRGKRKVGEAVEHAGKIIKR